MKLTVQHQESYSRGELLLRTFFGWLYIMIPHGFVLLFVALWSAILQFVAFWIILFTGRYPQSMFDFRWHEATGWHCASPGNGAQGVIDG